MRTLDVLTIKNFKSIRDQQLSLGRLNVFIGGNGSGKSNLISVFHFLSRIATRQLQTFTGIAGGADRILHFGRRVSRSLAIKLMFAEGAHANGYAIELVPTDEDRFIFEQETVEYQDKRRYDRPYRDLIGSGHAEAKLSTSENKIAKYVRVDLQTYRIYHFHDTSAEARVKQTASVDDNKILHPDAANLAAFLYRLKKTDPNCFTLIESTVRQIAPFFDRFDLEPDRLNTRSIKLEWREKGSDAVFTAQALSDGTLRFICLATLFLQPSPPPVILIDEPELGLHPAGVTVVASLLQSAATKTQVLAATQSVTLVNQLTPEDVWVVDRIEGASVFRHLKAENWSAWLDDYALGELWEKNLLGGRP
ncbi:MAG: AAA family ATPase [Acidobacteria bacterium]|nr:AAA family ATPase [Acidobacteriota bacterium]